MRTHSYPLITDHLAREILPCIRYGVKNAPRVCTLVPFIIVCKCKGNKKGKELLVGLGVGDNNCIWIEDSSAHHRECVAYGSIAMAAC